MTTPLIAIDASSLQQFITECVQQAIGEAFAARPAVVPDPPSDLLSRTETARLLHVSNQTLSAWEKRGLLIPTRAGRRVLFRRAEIDRFLSGDLTAGEETR